MWWCMAKDEEPGVAASLGGDYFPGASAEKLSFEAQHGGDSGRARGRAQAMHRHMFTYMRLGLGLELSRTSWTRDGITCIEGHLYMYFQKKVANFLQDALSTCSASITRKRKHRTQT